MTLRERFIEVMENFNPDVKPPKWEFGYWGETIDRWYSEGLVKTHYPKVPKRITTPTASLYTTAWNSIKPHRLPAGIAVIGGGLYWPTQGMPLEDDVREQLNMDYGQILVNVNLLFDPMFDIEVFHEDEKELLYRDVDGVTRKFLKETGVIPSGVKWVIKDEKSWKQLKEERLRLDNLKNRFPKNWDKLVKKYRSREYPLALGGYPHGYFGTLAHLMGYETLFYTYYDNPALIHEILNWFTELWIGIYSEVLEYTDVDMFVIWEDISAGSGSMVSPSIIKEFMVPYYKKLTGFLKEKGVNVIFVDTDGYCMEIIPLFIEAGVTGIYPIEVSCGMDLLEVRKHFPELRLMGGIPKSEIGKGKSKIDEILEPVEKVLVGGGYIPFGDHLIPPDVGWENFKYYREKLNSIIESKPLG